MNERQKAFTKVYFLALALGIIMFQWNTISWAFNYRVASGLYYDFFHPYQESGFLSANANAAVAKPNESQYPYTSQNDMIGIAKLGIEAPLVMGQSADSDALKEQLDHGVVIYPGSVMPGRAGQTILLGHSAPPGWPKIKYDWVFSEVSNLEAGDVVTVSFNHRQYTYKVTGKSIVQPGQEVAASTMGAGDNVLTIISCWPPGKNYKRIVVEAQLMPPVPGQ